MSSVPSWVSSACRSYEEKRRMPKQIRLKRLKQTVSVLSRSNETLAPSMEKLLDKDRLPLLRSLSLVMLDKPTEVIPGSIHLNTQGFTPLSQRPRRQGGCKPFSKFQTNLPIGCPAYDCSNPARKIIPKPFQSHRDPHLHPWLSNDPCCPAASETS